MFCVIPRSLALVFFLSLALAAGAQEPDEIELENPFLPATSFLYSFSTPTTITAITAGCHAGGNSSLRIGIQGQGIYELTGLSSPFENLKPLPSVNKEALPTVRYRHDPFGKTWWFLALGLMAIVFILALLHEHRVKQRIKNFWQIEQARRQENEQIRKQIARDFHDEFGHKLTNISLFTEILKQNLRATSPEDLKYLNKISDASRSLSMGIRDFIWTLDPQKDSLYDVAMRLKDFGDALYSSAGIDFHVTDIDKKYEEVGVSMAWRLTHWGEMKKYAHEIGGELIITSDPKGEHRMQFWGKIP